MNKFPSLRLVLCAFGRHKLQLLGERGLIQLSSVYQCHCCGYGFVKEIDATWVYTPEQIGGMLASKSAFITLVADGEHYVKVKFGNAEEAANFHSYLVRGESK